MATVCELDLRAPPNLMDLELGGGDVIWVHRVDADSVRMSDNDIEARWMEGYSLDRVLELLYDRKWESTWVSRIGPDHQGLIVGGCR